MAELAAQAGRGKHSKHSLLILRMPKKMPEKMPRHKTTHRSMLGRVCWHGGGMARALAKEGTVGAMPV